MASPEPIEIARLTQVAPGEEADVRTRGARVRGGVANAGSRDHGFKRMDARPPRIWTLESAMRQVRRPAARVPSSRATISARTSSRNLAWVASTAPHRMPG